jgi:hypothetical protein
MVNEGAGHCFRNTREEVLFLRDRCAMLVRSGAFERRHPVDLMTTVAIANQKGGVGKTLPPST